MDAGRHRTLLAAVERQLAELLDESAGCGDPETTRYRSGLWEAKATVKTAAEAITKMEGGR